MTSPDVFAPPIHACSRAPERGETAAAISAFTNELTRLTRDMTERLSLQRKILVVGGAGYIGSVLVRNLLTGPNHVAVLDNLLYDNGSSVMGLLELPNFSFIRGDLCDQTTLDQALAGVTDVVLLASLVGDPMCKKYPEMAKRVNLDGAIKLIEGLTGRGIRRFVFLSTCSNYGLRGDDTYATEISELNPKSLYAETKVAVEQYIMGNRDRFDFCPTILRAATAYGISERMRFDLTVSEFTRILALGQDLLVYDENTWRPYCHVQDISAAISKVLDTDCEDVCGEIFNVGSTEENYTKKMIVDIITSHTQSGKIEYKQGGFDPRNYRVSFDKIATRLGFANRYRVKSSIPRLAQAVQAGFFSDVESRKWFYGNYEMR
jgi:nucleoside-diphosphate-sugar epimerase